MDLGLTNKKVLVTGASKGIGKEIAIQFAKEGCIVSIIARNEEKLKEVVNEMNKYNQGHSYYAIDLLPLENPKKAINELLKDKKGFDIVVHSVGGTLRVRDVLSSYEDWLSVWRFNTGIAIEINNLLVPYMKEQKWGRIIHISSQSAFGLRGCGAYGASKAYLNKYAIVLGKGLAKDGIVVSAITPGSVYAPGGDWDENSSKNNSDIDAFHKKKADFLRHHMPIGRLGTADEIAPFALFLASKQASFAIGSVVPVDGGTD
ncbi:SDR family oxidoreductase [Candidatus Pacearchaeota archaeon]|nr:SDR family oxidoreductase [Candidatus Pacearchaeota archaeon]